MGIVGRFKDGDLLLAGEVDERLPVVTDSLTNFFPLDLTPQDRMTEYDNSLVIYTDRDWYPSGGFKFPSSYNYAGATFRISGKVRCIDAANPTLTTGIGFCYITTGGSYRWLHVKDFTLSAIKDNGFTTFYLNFTIPSDYQSDLKPWIQINISTGTTGYKVEYREIHYQMASNPNIRLTNGVFIDDALAIEEATTNYIVNGNFMNGLTNWAADANATTLTKIVTPWGYGVRSIRGAGNNADWSLDYKGPKPSYNAGETWVFSFKYRVIQGTGTPFYIGWWISDNGTYQNNLPITSIDIGDGWKLARASYTFIGGPYAGNVATFMNSQVRNTIIEFADIQLEKRQLPTGKIEGSRADGRLEIDLSPDATAHTLISEKMSIVDTAFTNHILTKDSSNIFTYYKNGSITTEFKNGWMKYSMKGVAAISYKGNDITKYIDPRDKKFYADPLSFSYSLASDYVAHFFRTFVYCSTSVSVWQRWATDNYGAMRINNGTIQNTGGYDWKTNPDVKIDLVQGWNVIEIWYMDSDSGGGISLQQNSQGKNSNYNTTPTDFVNSIPFSQMSQVLYMTAEIPIELSTNKIVFNEKANCIVKNAGLYNKAFSATDIQLFFKTQIPIDVNGILKVKVNEYPPYIPSDAYYFPLEANAKDFYNLYGPSAESNTVYDENGVWVGSATENLWVTKAGKPAISTNAGGIVILGGITPIIGSSAWTLIKTGSGNQCHYYEGVYGGAFTGATGDMIASSLYVRAVNKAGVDSCPFKVANTTGSWTAVADEQYADRIFTEDDKWYRKYAITKFNQSFTNGTAWDAFRWEYSTQKGLMYICAPQWEKRGFITPYVEGSRSASVLQYNFNRDLGLDWSKDWSITYFKTPVGSGDDTTQTHYNIESLGCGGSNTVGGGYQYWGKDNGSNALVSGSAFNQSNYFYHRRMVSLVYTSSNSTITIKEWSYTDGVSIRTISLSAPTANYFVTQYGFDFMLGGWVYSGGNGYSNSYYKDLVVCQRAFTDTELNNMFYDFGKFDTGNGRVYRPQNKIVETLTLS